MILKSKSAICSAEDNILTVQSDQTSRLPYYLYLSVAILWLYSGIVPVLFAQSTSLEMLAQLGIDKPYRMTLFIFSAVLDVIFGLLVLSRYRQRAWVWLTQLCVVVGYSIIVAIGLPENWFHPFAPLIKNIPIIALLFYLYRHHSFIA